VKAGRTVAFDLKLENGVGMVISSNGYKFGITGKGPTTMNRSEIPSLALNIRSESEEHRERG